MPDFPLQWRVLDYRTEFGKTVSAKGGYLLCEFPVPGIVCDALLDTAAPFSFVPFTLARLLPWNRLATQLSRGAAASAAVLSWQGIPCGLGTVALHFLDPAGNVRSCLVRITAKFPRRSTVPSLERTVALGLSLLDENEMRW
jgi:hypothetical protein